MDIKGNKHEIDKITEYQKRGYTANYKFEKGRLKDVETKKFYSSNEIIIEEEVRYEGFTNPSDLSILYILRMNDGSKGTILMPYGPNANADLALFLTEVSKNQLNK